MKASHIFTYIIERLKSEDFLMDFKFRKRDNCFIWHENGIGSMIELDHWIRDNMLTIYPIYIVRFDILKKWFEAYSFKTLRDQRDNPSVGFSGNMLERQDKFIFTESTIDTEYCKLCDTIKECAEIVFSHYANLQNMYDRRIVPILEGKQQLPDIGADWAFEYLTLTRIISPKDYEIVKDVIIKQIEWMNKRQEPNIVEYYPRLEEIIDSMEQQFPID